MKQITKTYTLYSFDELSEDAQQKAIEQLYDINVDYEWWDCTYDDAKNIGLKIEEFDIDRGSYVKGEFLMSGCEVANKILEDHGESCETYKTAKNFLNEWAELVKKYSDGINTDKVEEGKEYDFDDEANELEEEFLKSLCEDYRIMLQNEYEYQTSEKAIKETIKCNDYTFLEDGTIY